MRPPFRILIAAAVAGLALAAPATASATVSPCFDVAVTGSIDGQPFSGTLKIEQFTAAPSGIQVQVAGLVGIDGVIVASRQQLAVQNLAVLSDLKLAQGTALGFGLPAVQASGGRTVSLDPVLVTDSQLPAGADGNLDALAELLGNSADPQAVADLLDTTFGLTASP